MTKTPTEQWREGTLPEGLYYVEGKGNYDIALIRNRYCPVLTSPYCENNVFESEFKPIDHVPSYAVYKRLVSNSDESSRKALQLEKRLEECEEALKWAYIDCLDEGFETELGKKYLEKWGIEI